MFRTTWMILAAAVAFGAGAALASPAPGPGAGSVPGPGGYGGRGADGMGLMDGGMIGVPHPRMLERMASELQLTADQQQALKGVFESARPEMEQVRGIARQNAEKLRSATPGTPGYDAVVSEVARSAGDLATRAVNNGAQLRAQVWSVLTPEQRQKLGALQAQRQERMKARMEQRRPKRAAAP